jgi:hypothetical protein
MVTRNEIRDLVRSGNYAVWCGDPILRMGVDYTLAQYIADAWRQPLARTYGMWNGQTDAGFLLRNVDARASIEQARTFNQTCVLSNDALWYPGGAVTPMDSANASFWEVDTDSGADYTLVDCEDGKLYFSVPEYSGNAKEKLDRWSRCISALKIADGTTT